MPKEKKKPTKKTFKPGKDIVSTMVEDFKKKLQKVVGQGIKEITIDFSGVSEVDASGIGLLVATHNSLKEEGGVLKVKNLSEKIYLLFKVIQMDQHLEMP